MTSEWREFPGVGLIFVRKVTERDAAIIAQYRSGMTMEQVGAAHGFTRERARQILARHGLTRRDGGQSVLSGQRKTAAEQAREARCVRKWGLSLQEFTDHVERWGNTGVRGSPMHRYMEQRRNAVCHRRIGWEFTFKTWWDLWQRSGKWEQRGRGEGYCMARNGDVGPYSPTNVYICTIGQNFSDSYNIDHPRRPKARRLPVQASAYKVKDGQRWMVQVKPLAGKRYFGGFTSKEEAEQHGLALLRAA